ncbi:tetratricopeptide repeat protein [Helicobacter salomonis]|uniref:tetratricopeptide repeat protein n=1 Tax=Helicobacter salomonis TaxID=56878 RepID=UPI000CF08805|nr:tetratricopeptide repeat protein [Helicobacter salomonis]
MVCGRMIKVLWALVLSVGLCGAQSAYDLLEQGRTYYKQGDYSKAFESFQKAANAGNAEAYNNLGVMYTEGEGVG